MAEAALGRPTSFPQLQAFAIEWLLARREAVAIVSLMAVAAVLHLWDLGDMALHHDESLHAQFSWYLYEGRGYTHDPLLHGPFQFHAVAAIYFLFGDTDFTARLLPAIFGTVLVGMPYLLRRQIGMKAVIIAAVFLCFSPTILYFGRFLRNDIYLAVFMLGMVICVWRYLDEGKSRYLVALSLLMALSYATKEVTFISIAILLVYLDLMLAFELGRRRIDDVAGDRAVFLRSLALAPVAWLIAAFWPLLGPRPFGRDRLPLVGDLLVVVGTLTLPQFAAAIQVLPFVGDDGYNVPSERPLRLATVLTLLVASAYVGLLWRPKLWLACAAVFFIPFVLLYTTFFTNLDGFFSGIWGSLDYWLGQHEVKRGNQPRYYYALLTPLYEFLPLLLTAGGLYWLLRRGNSLLRWLPFWLLGSFVGLSLAGEKMPWLETHIALPLALCGAVVLARLVEALDFDGRRWLVAAAASLATAAALLLLLETDATVTRVLGGIIGGIVVGWALGTVAGGRKALLRSLSTLAVAALFVLTVRASITAAFTHDDTPVELLVYTQTSPDLPLLTHRINVLAAESGLGYNLPIVVDTELTWPMVWYLRDYHDVRYISDFSELDDQEGAVMLVSNQRIGSVRTFGFNQEPFKLRWWFVETYRNLTPGKVLDIATSPSSLKALADFFLHRRPAEGTTGSFDAVALFPNSLAAFDTGLPAQPPPEPSLLVDGRIIFGRTGGGTGETLQAADVSVDPDGNIWVADASNHRILKYAPLGDYIETLTGDAFSGGFNQPWSMTVDEDGFIYVADTWNHRIEKYAPDHTLVALWGEPSGLEDAGPLELFGPRDIVIGPDGNLWFTDTGHKRIVNITRDGDPVATYGGPGSAIGQFEEPVGLTFGDDGRLYVVDTWNGRIQSFASGDPLPAAHLPDGLPIAVSAAGDEPVTPLSDPITFEVGWTSQDVISKPYVAVLPDGRVVTTKPETGELALFAPDGSRIGNWTPVPGGLPIGVDTTSAGGFVFSDGQRNEMQIVPPAAIDTLFK